MGAVMVTIQAWTPHVQVTPAPVADHNIRRSVCTVSEDHICRRRTG